LLDALRHRLGDHVEITAARGCDIDRGAPPIDARWLRTAGGEPGLDVELAEGAEPGGAVVRRSRAVDTRFLFLGEPAPGLGADFSLRATGTLVPPETGTYTFSIVEAGRARLLVDGDVVVDGTTGVIPRGHEFFGLGSIELTAEVDLVAGDAVAIALEYSSRDSGGLGAVKLGSRPPGSEAGLLAEASRVAAAADLVVVAVGTNDDWESEGHDRDTLALPGAQDAMLEQVIAANPNTVVVVNAGAPVLLDATEGARAVLQAWFGGQEMADALVDVLLGDAEPSGRLPTTIPRRLEDNPSYGNFPGEDGEVRYGEGLLMGYRWYDTRGIVPRHPFGHGTSYTTFDIGAPELSNPSFKPGEQLEVHVTVTNRGDRRGAEVVQCYVGAEATARFRPKQELRAFEKVWLDPGEARTVRLVLSDRSFATWVPAAHAWQVEPGSYAIKIGRSSADITHRAVVSVAAT
jgi:beta-glucosidase